DGAARGLLIGDREPSSRTGIKCATAQTETQMDLCTSPLTLVSDSAVSVRDAPARPTRAEVEAAIRTILASTGDDPTREGLIDTPARVARAYGEWFGG